MKFREEGLRREDSYKGQGLVSGEFVQIGKGNPRPGRERGLKSIREKEGLCR